MTNMNTIPKLSRPAQTLLTLMHGLPQLVDVLLNDDAPAGRGRNYARGAGLTLARALALWFAGLEAEERGAVLYAYTTDHPLPWQVYQESEPFDTRPEVLRTVGWSNPGLGAHMVYLIVESVLLTGWLGRKPTEDELQDWVGDRGVLVVGKSVVSDIPNFSDARLSLEAMLAAFVPHDDQDGSHPQGG